MGGWKGAALAAVLLACGAAHAQAPSGDSVEEQSIEALANDLAHGSRTSEQLVRHYLDRIESLDRRGPHVNSVIARNPDALEQARALDAERRAGHVRGPLHGVPILLKDNIETRDPMPTTAGSLALARNVTGRDAPLVARLRAAGAIVLGKTNLSEWANFRSDGSSSGWSAVGGQTHNPYVLDRNPCGSSSGSGAATAASFAAAAIGTETDGSIVCPSSVNGLVGVKPTVGLVSRTYIVPISASQDTAGPMARSVRDAALLLSVIAGSDPLDPATKDADAHKQDYLSALNADALRGKRIGVARFAMGGHASTDAVFETALAALRAGGAALVDIDKNPAPESSKHELVILLAEFKAGLNAYLAGTKPELVPTRSLRDLIEFNKREPRELALFGQDTFDLADAAPGLDSPEYSAAQAFMRDTVRANLDALLAREHLDAIVAPTLGPAGLIDHVIGDHFVGGASRLAAVSGYPHVTVPMGQVRGLPVGLSIYGAPWSEAKLLAIAFAFEQRTRARTPPRFLSSLAD